MYIKTTCITPDHHTSRIKTRKHDLIVDYYSEPFKWTTIIQDAETYVLEVYETRTLNQGIKKVKQYIA